MKETENEVTLKMHGMKLFTLASMRPKTDKLPSSQYRGKHNPIINGAHNIKTNHHSGKAY
jgi:hypothetical protein